MFPHAAQCSKIANAELYFYNFASINYSHFNFIIVISFHSEIGWNLEGGGQSGKFVLHNREPGCTRF